MAVGCRRLAGMGIRGWLVAVIVVGVLGACPTVAAAEGVAVSFTRAWGWGVADGQDQFEICTTVCQAGDPGATEGLPLGKAGMLDQPNGVGVDLSGDVFVADNGNERIDEFSPLGVFVRAWGWGVSDGQNRFEICTSACQAGAENGGEAAGQLESPRQLAVSSGDVYVADAFGHRIDEFSLTGSFVRAWGFGVADGQPQLETCTTVCQAGIGGGSAGQLNSPNGVAVSNSGDVYVSDTGNERIDEFAPSGAFVRAWGWGVADDTTRFEECTSYCGPGFAGGGAGQLDQPTGLAVDGPGNVYVADQRNYRISEFTSTGSFVRTWGWGVSDGSSQPEVCTSDCQTGVSGGGAGEVDYPEAIAVDGSGHVYVTSLDNSRIDEFTSSGDFVAAWGGGVSDGANRFEVCSTSCQPGRKDSGAGDMDIPAGVAIDSAGQVFVGDAFNNRIDEFSQTITSVPPTITSGQSASFTERVADSFTVTSSGVPTPSLSESGALPSGVTFTASGAGTATISGTPAPGSAGSYPIRVTAANGVSPDATQAFTLTVLAAVHHPGPPWAQILFPHNHRRFVLDRRVRTKFRCHEARHGPGLKSCIDSNGVRGRHSRGHGWLDTGVLGTHVYRVTAVSRDGQRATATITYRVVLPRCRRWHRGSGHRCSRHRRGSPRRGGLRPPEPGPSR